MINWPHLLSFSTAERKLDSPPITADVSRFFQIKVIKFRDSVG